MVEHLERQTHLIKLMLVLMRDRKARQAQVRTVGYIREYGAFPEELGVATLGNMSDEELVSLADQIGMKQRPTTGKSDIYMNDLGYKLIFGKEKFTLVDRAPIQELIEVAEQLQLVDVAKELANRLKLIELSPINEVKRNEWVKLISHWICKGNVASPSKFPVDLVLCYLDPFNMNTWDIYEPEAYIDAVWENVEFQVDGEHNVSISVGMEDSL